MNHTYYITCKLSQFFFSKSYHLSLIQTTQFTPLNSFQPTQIYSIKFTQIYVSIQTNHKESLFKFIKIL